MGALCVAARRAASTESLAFLVAARGVALTRVTVWGCGCRVDALAWVCYCLCCQRDAWAFALAYSVEFFACRLILVGRRILTPLIQVRVLAGELNETARSRLLVLDGPVTEWLR